MSSPGRGTSARKMSILQRDAMLVSSVVYGHKDDNPLCGISQDLPFCSLSYQKCPSLYNIIAR